MENTAQNCRSGKREIGKCGTKIQVVKNAGLENTAEEILGWKMREVSMETGKRTGALYGNTQTVLSKVQKCAHSLFTEMCEIYYYIT